MKKAVFLDRDGVINEICYHHDIGVYSARDISEFKVMKGAKEAIKAFHELGYMVVVVSNQPEVDFGYIREEDLEEIDEYMRTELGVDAVYNCTKHPHHSGDSPCRKPKDGMLLKAAEEHGIDLSASYMIGDNLTDIAAGKRCKETILIGPQRVEIYTIMEKNGIHPDHFVRNITEAADIIRGQER
jgi:D-glycero-D-manno-heptose 1,7-bisphosphate phosphatase